MRSEKVYTRHGVPISVTGIAQVPRVPPGTPSTPEYPQVLPGTPECPQVPPAPPLLNRPVVGPAWRCGGAALKWAMSRCDAHWDAALS